MQLTLHEHVTVGTGNDIATVFGVPGGDINALIDCLINGKDKKFDIGYCQMADRSNKGNKKRSGTGNYQLAIYQTLLKFKPYNIIIEPDSSEPISGPRMLIAIGNGKRYGGGLHICPEASPDDGKFHGTTLKK